MNHRFVPFKLVEHHSNIVCLDFNLGKSKIQPKIDVKSRLGLKIDSRNLTRTKILLNKSKRLNEKKTSNVFDRLGK